MWIFAINIFGVLCFSFYLKGITPLRLFFCLPDLELSVVSVLTFVFPWAWSSISLMQVRGRPFPFAVTDPLRFQVPEKQICSASFSFVWPVFLFVKRHNLRVLSLSCCCASLIICSLLPPARTSFYLKVPNGFTFSKRRDIFLHFSTVSTSSLEPLTAASLLYLSPFFRRDTFRNFYDIIVYHP